MAYRRTSALPDDKLGQPYQIYAEVINTGKNVQGTKRKVRWVFGFSDEEGNVQHEVILKHSLLTGRKTVTEDGREIVEATNMLAQDFAHGWTSNTSYRLYRVEAELGITSDTVYVFSIDGEKFSDFPRQPVRKRTPDPSAKEPNASAASSTPQRSSSITASKAKPTVQAVAPPVDNRGPFQSPYSNPGATAQSFDMFEIDNNDSFDPFADNSSNSSFTNASISAVPGSNRTSVGKQSAAASLFDAFETDSTGPSVNANSFDLFADSTPASTYTDPFSAPPIASVQTQPKPVAIHSKHHAKPLSSPSLLDVGPSQEEQRLNGTHNKSTSDIAKDFEGLMFDTPAVAPARNVALISKPQEEHQPRPKSEPIVSDPWKAADLVDLDLTGRNRVERNKQTRSSVYGGPSLAEMMGSSVTQPSSDPNGRTLPPETVSNPFDDPFGAPALLPPTPAKAAIDLNQLTTSQIMPTGTGLSAPRPMNPGFGGPVNQMGMGNMLPRGNMMGMQPQPGSIGGMGQMGMPPMQPPNAGPAMMGSNSAMKGNRGSINLAGQSYDDYLRQQQNGQARSSLDTLNWKG